MLLRTEREREKKFKIFLCGDFTKRGSYGIIKKTETLEIIWR